MRTRTLIILAALPLAIGAAAPSSCADRATSGINEISGALTSPQATQAFANLKAGAVAIACDTANISGLVASIAKQVGGTSHGNVVFTRDATSVYVAASTLCTAGGGIVEGKETIPSTSKAIALPAS
jgi:hypothetical protein